MLFLHCIEAAKELPPTRFQQASTGAMIQSNNLRGFIVSRGEPRQILLWKVDALNDIIKQCALTQIPNDTKALVIEDNIERAQQYLNTSSSPIEFSCIP